jgi:hypothetical protein
MIIKRWLTLKGQANVLAKWADRIQFEYEERRNWYAMRIRKLTAEDEGLWKCRMVVKLNDGIARRYESRKQIHLKNRTDFVRVSKEFFFIT